MVENEAVWLRSPVGRLRIGPAPMPTPGPGEIVVRVRAVAVNPVDAMSGLARPFVTPWLRYPAVLGSDVAGEVVAVGPDVRRFGIGARVLGSAAGQERHRNAAAEGAFQRFVLLQERNCAPVPASMPLEDAAVLPLALTTAAAGLYEPDQLGLAGPSLDPEPRRAVVLVWGASTSVGCNAVQLARASGYDVLGTASDRNHDLVRGLGAEQVFDYHDPDAERRITDAIGDRPLAGTIAIGAGSLTRTLRVVRATAGSRRLASAYPTPATRLRARSARREGITVSAIWGGTPLVSQVGPLVYEAFLPQALATGRYVAAPEREVVGHGIAAVPEALARLRRGVSARKLVVTLD
ncbi:zinc-binding alcohol dehydrogenase family protein [Curtobacterium sp. MCBD17_035]|uniref:zinc-binding alcohol dehydrogenase family protein n=1 Tax=Curtobacterium sp. MCBD17_035 TaxID=2175673 RepID=UPI000DA86A1E|nr:zinc-binding alcohol dehydrogenase family protein [Curtobacterium sp. MCBD17_035]WIB68413.1 zinc-binding alcohol dehydrogenase family protein [Curtobacterium sp. MCBD17_035]